MAIHGTVSRIEAAHGFGLIRDDHGGDWIFDHQVTRSADHEMFAVGQRVTFEQEWTPQGPRATRLRAESEGQ